MQRLSSIILFLLIAFLPRANAAGDSVVVVNEIHYNPLDPALEFVELHNPGAAAVNIGG